MQSVEGHNHFFNHGGSRDYSRNMPNSGDDGFVEAKIMADNFQCGGTGNRQDGSFESPKHFDICGRNGHRRQYAEPHTGNGEKGTKRLLKSMGADQREDKELNTHHRTSAF